MAASYNAARSVPGRRGVGESLILKRRQREDHLASYSTSVKGISRLNARAEWEDSLFDKGVQEQIQRTIAQLKNQEESQLHSRKLRLAELYNCEMDAWRKECLANVETPEDRKQKMIQRAMALKERREEERQAIVEEKRLQQYRESCDDIRVEDAHKVLQIVLNDRDKQLQERTQIAQQERELELKMAQLWEEDRLKKEERERQDNELATKRNKEMKHILDLQVELVQKQRAELDERKRSEEYEQLTEWERLKQVEEELKQFNRNKEITRALDVKTFNQERVEATRAAIERTRLYDQQLLAQVLAQEAEAQRHEREVQEQFRQEQVAYQQQLKRQMETEARDLSHLDHLRKDLEDQVWAKRDAEHDAAEAARQELMRQVVRSRTAQINTKRAVQAQAIDQEREYLRQLNCDADEALQKELYAQEERRNELKRTQCELLRQQKEKQVAMEEAKQREFLELKRMQRAEKHHQERVKDFAQQLPPTNFRRKTAQWYFDV